MTPFPNIEVPGWGVTRPIGSKDITPRNRRTQRRIDTLKDVHDKPKAHLEAYDKQKDPKEKHGEQESPAWAYIEQENCEEVRDKETTIEEA